MEPLFADKRGLITGVFNKQSIAWAIAEKILDEGGTCGFSYMPDKPDDERKKNLGRVTKLTEGNPNCAFLQPMDVTNDEHIAALMDVAKEKLGKLDFLLHSIAFALPDDLKGDTIDTSRAGFKLAMEISAYSLIALAKHARPLLNENASILDAHVLRRRAARAGLQRDGHLQGGARFGREVFGVRSGCAEGARECAEPGPLQTISGRGAGVDEMLGLYEAMAPLGRNVTHEEAGKCGAFLLSDMSSGITGEILHLDGGYNIMGSPGRMLDRVKAGV